MADLMNNANTEILKLPLGFIRIIQFPLIIIAFATLCSYDAQTSYKPTLCPDAEKVTIKWDYPFHLADSMAPYNSCLSDSFRNVTIFHQGASGAKFFVFVGVVSMLFVIGITLVYLFAWGEYESNEKYPMIDLLATGILAFCWFIASIMWASGLGGLKTLTNKKAIEHGINGYDVTAEKYSLAYYDHGCDRGVSNCVLTETWKTGSLTISVIAGFTCFGLFAANLWFIYKETSWFRNRNLPPEVTGGGGGAPTPSQPYP